jgi:hypothetical protein
MGILCIINYSISQTLNWSLYPIGALFVVWATLAPIDLPQYKLLGSFIGFSMTLIPYLYIVANLSGDGEWFWPLAFPLALSFIITAGIFIAFFTRLGNKWFTGAGAFFLFGVVLNFVVGEIIENYLKEQNIQGQIINRFTLYSFLFVSFLFALIGFQRSKKV